VGVLDRFEKGIERAVNGAFAKAFRSEVQPVEIASALRRECDDRSSIVGRDRTIAPNSFVVELGPGDYERLGEWKEALGEELTAVVHDHARQQRYAFVGPVVVDFEQADDLDTGVFRVRSATSRPSGEAAHRSGPAAEGYGPPSPGPGSAAGPGYGPGGPFAGQPAPGFPPGGPPPAPAFPAAGPPYAEPYQQDPYRPDAHQGAPYPPPYPPAPYPPAGYAPGPQPEPYPGDRPRPSDQPYPHPSDQPHPSHPGGPASLEVDGQQHQLTKQVTVLGRALDVDIVLDDPGVSRRHAEIHLIDGRARVIDLGSTNGTFVDGERVHAGDLNEGSTITVGRSRLVFHSGLW
jgi:hypothetical protein